MKYFIAILIVIYFISSIPAQSRTVSEEQVKIQLQLNKQKWLSKQQNKKLSYNEAYDLAWDNYRPLFIWVGVENEDIEKSFTQGVHVHITEYKDVNGSGLVIGIRKDGKFQRFDITQISDEKIREVLNPPQVVPSHTPVTPSFAPQPFVPATPSFTQNFFQPQQQIAQPMRQSFSSGGGRNC